MEGRRRSLVPRILLTLFIGLVVGGALLVFGVSRVGTLKSGYLTFDVGAVPEEAPVVLFGTPPLTGRELFSAMHQAKGQSRVKGLILKVHSGAGGLARTQAMRRAIVDFKASGKPVVAFLESGGLGSYYLASAADQVVLVPTGDLSVVGLAIESGFWRGTLDWLGIYPDFLHAGKYKSYAESYTNTEMSDASREVANALLDDVYGQLVADIAVARNLSVEEVRAAIDVGPLSAAEALERKLVDKLAYWDEVEDQYRDKDADEIATVSARSLVPSAGLSFSPAQIALVYETGEITGGESSEDPLLGGKSMGSDTIAEILRDIRGQDSIKAVVMRVDSPGGSGLASDVIWREVERLKGAGKSVIVSMGDVAASGGYYISCGADVIVAEEGTLTGSIGVVTGKFALQGLYDKIGYSTEVVKRGRNATIESSTTPFSDSEREAIERQLDHFYHVFVDRVAKGRGMTWDEVHEVAQGRVWTGAQAVEIGLVDEIGGLDRALAIAKEKAGLSADAVAKVAVYPRKRTFVDILLDQQSTRVMTPELLASLPSVARESLRAARTIRLFENETVLSWMPARIALR